MRILTGLIHAVIRWFCTPPAGVAPFRKGEYPATKPPPTVPPPSRDPADRKAGRVSPIGTWRL